MKKYVGYLKEKKRVWIIALGAILGGLLIFFGSVGENSSSDISDKDIPSDESAVLSYGDYIEAKIKNLCKKVDGVSDVEVMVTLENGFEQVYANDGEYVIVGSGNNKTPVLIKKNLPKIRGIGIVCSGAENAMVQKEICDLLCAALDVSSNRIYVTKGK